MLLNRCIDILVSNESYNIKTLILYYIQTIYTTIKDSTKKSQELINFYRILIQTIDIFFLINLVY